MLPHPPLPHTPRSQIYTGVSVTTFSLYSEPKKKKLSKTTFSPILTHPFGYVPLAIDLFPVINQMEVDLASQGDPDLPDKESYRSVSGLTGTGSSRWSDSPVPALAGEAVHRLEPTGSPVWTGYPVEMSSQGVIVDLVS
jgi:hypothetical protein